MRGTHTVKTLLDRVDTTHVRNLDRMIAELSPHMTELELDRAVDVLNTMACSRWDINLTVSDAATQLKLLFGAERYETIKTNWARKNQHLMRNLGTKKYMHVATGALYDGLDPTDDPKDYEVIYV